MNAQSASISYYGATCGPQSPSGSPRIYVGLLPKLGGFTVVQQQGVMVQLFPDCKWGAAIFLAIGSSRTQSSGTGLPFVVPTWLTAGWGPCFVWTSAELILPPVVLSQSTTLTIPNNPGLLGAHLYLQYLVFYANGGAACYPLFERWMTSDCADLTIGT